MSLAVAWNAVKLFGPLSTALLLFICQTGFPRTSKEGYLHGEHHSTSAVVSLTALWSIIGVSQRSISFLENAYVAPNWLRVVDSDAVRRELGCVCLNGHAMRKKRRLCSSKRKTLLTSQSRSLRYLPSMRVSCKAEQRHCLDEIRSSPLDDSVENELTSE